MFHGGSKKGKIRSIKPNYMIAVGAEAKEFYNYYLLCVVLQAELK